MKLIRLRGRKHHKGGNHQAKCHEVPTENHHHHMNHNHGSGRFFNYLVMDHSDPSHIQMMSPQGQKIMILVQTVKFFIDLIFTIPLWVGMFMMFAHNHSAASNFLNNPIFQLVNSTLVFFVFSFDFFIEVWRGIIRKKPNMFFLVVLGCLSAYAWGLYLAINNHWQTNFNGEHLPFEIINTTVTFVCLGHILEILAERNTTRSIQSLSELIPAQATILVDHQLQTVNSQHIKNGDLVVVKPGNSIPTDGIIISGETHTDESLLTGEAKPVLKLKGEKVVSGTINLDGVITFRATTTTKNNTVAKIIADVKMAQMGKTTKLTKLVDILSTWFFLVVVIIALITFGSWIAHDNYVSARAIKNTISVLIVACPCALALATPTVIIVASGKAARLGIVIKNGGLLEEMASVNTFVFDKTGTLTSGKMNLKSINSLNKAPTSQIKTYLISLEANSSHPIAQAIIKDLEDVKKLKVTNFQNVPSVGVYGTIDRKRIGLVSPGAIKNIDEKIKSQWDQAQKNGHIVFVMTIDSEPTAFIVMADKPKKEAKKTISRLTKMNYQVAMLTGDNKFTAAHIAHQLGINKVYSQVAIKYKAGVIKELKKNKNVVAMIGDGINDSVALTEANIGISFTKAVDVAKESSQILILNDDLMAIVKLVNLSYRTNRKIRENLFWVFFYNNVMIPLAAFGILMPEVSAILMALSSLTIVFNSLLLNTRHLERVKNVRRQAPWPTATKL